MVIKTEEDVQAYREALNRQVEVSSHFTPTGIAVTEAPQLSSA